MLILQFYVCFLHLHGFYARSNKLDAHDIKELSPFFDLMPVLNQINLSENPIGDVGLRSVAIIFRRACYYLPFPCHFT